MNTPAGIAPRKLKVFGERNTATRAVMQMLRNLDHVSLGMPHRENPDLDALVEQAKAHLNNMPLELFRDAIEDERWRRNGGMSDWKHAAPRIDNSYAILDASVIFLVRNPYSWIWSLAQRGYHSRTVWQPDFNRFIQTPWLCLKRDNIAPFLSSPMQLWNEKLARYRVFAQKAPVPSTVLKFEEFVATPVRSLARSLREFGISDQGLATVQLPTKANGTGHAKRRKFYTEEGWRAYFSASTVTLVNEIIDWELAGHFGYERLEPDDFPQQASAAIVNKLSRKRTLY